MVGVGDLQLILSPRSWSWCRAWYSSVLKVFCLAEVKSLYPDLNLEIKSYCESTVYSSEHQVLICSSVLKHKFCIIQEYHRINNKLFPLSPSDQKVIKPVTLSQKFSITSSNLGLSQLWLA